jgi:carbamoyltransferase
MVILGLNANHPDSSACILIDGKIVIAIEEERINRIKHWSGLPILSIKECLKKTGLSSKRHKSSCY